MEKVFTRKEIKQKSKQYKRLLKEYQDNVAEEIDRMYYMINTHFLFKYPHRNKLGYDGVDDLLDAVSKEEEAKYSERIEKLNKEFNQRILDLWKIPESRQVNG